MQLSTPASPDPNLLTLLFLAPAGGAVIAPDAPAAPGTVLDFAALLAAPVPSPAMAASPPEAPPDAENLLTVSLPASDATTASPVDAATAPLTLPLPRAWPFSGIRPVSLMTMTPAEAPGSDVLAEGEADATTDEAASKVSMPTPRVGVVKIPEGESRPAPRRDAEREKIAVAEPAPLTVPLEITPVALGVGLPAQQRFVIEAENMAVTNETETDAMPGGAGSPVRAMRLGSPLAPGDFPTATSVDVAGPVGDEVPDDAVVPRIPFHFARPAAVAFPSKPSLDDFTAEEISTGSAPIGNEATLRADASEPAVTKPAFAFVPAQARAEPAPAEMSFADAPVVSFTETSAPRAVPPSPERPVPAPESAAPEQAAEFAVNFEANPAETPRREIGRTRNFVTASEKQLTSRTPDLGTAVAKTATAMPSASILPRPTHAAFETASLLVDPFDGTHDARVDAADLAARDAQFDTSAPETVSTAHRAVEAALTAAQRFSANDRHTVNLQFSVGGTDLNVRVELRADEVRATFRTDSPELRAALSHEWQAAAGQGDRSVRLATPVFTGSDASGFSASSGDHASQQHRQSSARAMDEQFAFATARSGAKGETAVATNSSVTPRAPLSTALHLHTLA